MIYNYSSNEFRGKADRVKEENMQLVLSSNWFRRLAMVMVVIMGLIGMIPQADAGFIPSAGTAPDRTQDMAAIQNVLENKLVVERLKSMGYSQDEVQARLAQLSDQEVHQLASDIDALAPAGDALGIVVALLVIVILVLVILKLA